MDLKVTYPKTKCSVSRLLQMKQEQQPICVVLCDQVHIYIPTIIMRYVLLSQVEMSQNYIITPGFKLGCYKSWCVI